jgi:hypothetical protein
LEGDFLSLLLFFESFDHVASLYERLRDYMSDTNSIQCGRGSSDVKTKVMVVQTPRIYYIRVT